MYNRSQYQPTRTGLNFHKSRSTGNFYPLPSERSFNLQPKEECLACHHEKAHQHKKLKTFASTSKTKLKHNAEQYYATQDKQMTNLRKAKRFLQEMLQKNRNQLRKTTEQYQNKISALTHELQQKTQQFTQLQISFHQLQAQQQYQANASLVRSYKQINLNSEDEEQNKNKKIKQLTRKNALLQQQIVQKQQQIESQRKNVQSMQEKLQKMKDYQYYAQEYEAMRALINKMELQKLQLLDKHHQELQFLQRKFKQDINNYEMRIADLKTMNEGKSKQVELLDRELKQIKTQLNSFKSNQFHTLKELLDQKERECQALESKITCIQSEVNFLKGRYGYILKLARNDQLNDPNQNEEYCIERVGRFNISAGKESLLGMNLSPIRRR